MIKNCPQELYKKCMTLYNNSNEMGSFFLRPFGEIVYKVVDSSKLQEMFPGFCEEPVGIFIPRSHNKKSIFWKGNYLNESSIILMPDSVPPCIRNPKAARVFVTISTGNSEKAINTELLMASALYTEDDLRSYVKSWAKTIKPWIKKALPPERREFLNYLPETVRNEIIKTHLI